MTTQISVCVCVYVFVRLTPAVLGIHSISIVTGLTELTLPPGCVSKAMLTLATDGIAVFHVADIHIAVTLTADASPTHHCRVTVETAGTSGGSKER